MNCSEFDQVVMDVARSETRGLAMDAVVKQQALAHAESCARCAACLAGEISLSQGLRAVAVGDSSLGAPAFVETALLAAFRERQEAQPVPAVVTPVVKETPLQLFFFRMKWAFAAAAALALIAFALSRLMQSTPVEEQPIVNHFATPSPSATANSQEPEPSPPQPQPEPSGGEELVMRASTTPRIRPTKRAVNPQVGRVTVDVGPFVEIDTEPETLSPKDFLVFDYARNLPPADSTQLMRVRMPRERLAPLGLPLPRAMRSDDYVNADLLVGSDGVPRAIRVANR